MERMLVAVLLSCACFCVADDAQSESYLRSTIADLRSPVASVREDAAERLRERPDIRAIRPLLEAAKRETEEDVLPDMLLALGQSGMMEALGLIQTHAQSPVDDVRDAGRKALRLWLITNGVLAEDDDLPDPPHAYYERPPEFPEDRAAGRPIEVWAGQAPLSEPPKYTPAYSSGVPEGLSVRDRPRWGLVAAGLGTFLGLYVPTVISVAATEAAPEMLLPVAGPTITAVGLEGFASILVPFLVLNSVGQATGVALLIAGGVANDPLLEADHVSVQLTPGGLSGQF